MSLQFRNGIARTVVIEYEQDGQLCFLRCVLPPGKAVRDYAGRVLARAIIHAAPHKPYRGEVHREPQKIINAIAGIPFLSGEISAITLILCGSSGVEVVSIQNAVIFVD